MLPNGDMTEVGERVRKKRYSSINILMFALDRASHSPVARSNASISAAQFTPDQTF